MEIKTRPLKNAIVAFNVVPIFTYYNFTIAAGRNKNLGQ